MKPGEGRRARSALSAATTAGMTEVSRNMQQVLHKPIDEESFLGWVVDQEGRYELVSGDIVMMTGASRSHGLIARRLAGILAEIFVPRGHEVFQSDLGIRTSRGIRYPDVVVDASGAAGPDLVSEHPLLLVEILSPSSMAADFGEKVQEYKSIETLHAYLILAQERPRAWLWLRSREGWPDRPQVFEGSDTLIAMPALELNVPLDRLYFGIADEL